MIQPTKYMITTDFDNGNEECDSENGDDDEEADNNTN